MMRFILLAILLYAPLSWANNATEYQCRAGYKNPKTKKLFVHTFHFPTRADQANMGRATVSIQPISEFQHEIRVQEGEEILLKKTFLKGDEFKEENEYAQIISFQPKYKSRSKIAPLQTATGKSSISNRIIAAVSILLFLVVSWVTINFFRNRQ